VIPAIFRRPVLGLWDRNGVISRLARRGINGIPAYPRPHRNIRQTQRRSAEWKEAWTARSTVAAHGTTTSEDERHISRRALSGGAWLSVEGGRFDSSDARKPAQGSVIRGGRRDMELREYECIRSTDPAYACLYAGASVTAETRRG
jgi:hypothetical protein